MSLSDVISCCPDSPRHTQSQMLLKSLALYDSVLSATVNDYLVFSPLFPSKSRMATLKSPMCTARAVSKRNLDAAGWNAGDNLPHALNKISAKALPEEEL